MKILVIGAGTIGLPFGLHLSKNGHEIDFTDSCSHRIQDLKSGKDQFSDETGLRDIFFEMRNGVRFFHLSDLRPSHYDCIVFTAGIGNQNAEAAKLYRQYKPLCEDANLILFRTTINKQQWDLLKLEVNLGKFTYIPERSRPGNIIEEIKSLPQMIGHESQRAFAMAYEVLNNIVGECIDLSVVEAISAKLLTNAWRAAEFDLANKFFIDCHRRGLSFDKISSIAKKDYPRLSSLPLAGFISGPCLPKDYVSWRDWEETSPQSNESLNGELLQLFISSILIKYPNLKMKKIVLFGDSYRNDYQDERGAISMTVQKILSELGADVKICSHTQKDEILQLAPDLVINLFPNMEKIEEIEQFNFWSRP